MRYVFSIVLLSLALLLGPAACQTTVSNEKAPHASPSCGHCPTLSEWKALLNSGNFAIVSAGRNSTDLRVKALSGKELGDRHRELARELTGFRFAFYEGQGHYQGAWETVYVLRLPSGFDVNILRDLGRRYQQQSIIVARDGEQALIYTAGREVGQSYRGRGWREVKGGSGDYTEVQSSDGKQLRFQLNYDFKKSLPYE